MAKKHSSCCFYSRISLPPHHALVQSDSVLGDFRDKSNCSDKVTEFSCACLLCLCCPLSMVWCCVKTSCKKGRCLAVKAMHRACCRLDKRIYAEYSSFSDIDTDYQASKRHMLSEIPVPVKNRWIYVVGV